MSPKASEEISSSSNVTPSAKKMASRSGSLAAKDFPRNSTESSPDDICLVRFNCTQSWFLASSWTVKESFLTALLNSLNRDASLLILLNVLDCRRDKIGIYSESFQSTNFVYDRKLRDHNRSLNDQYLSETIDADVEWYRTLDASKQIYAIFQLLKLSGGAMSRIIFNKALALHRKKSAQPTSNIQPKSARLDKEIFKKLIKPYDPKDPHSIEVERARKKWQKTINKYRVQVEGRPEKSKKADDKKGKKKDKKKAKSSESSKTSKTSKSSKSSKKSKASKKIGKGKKGKKDQERLMIDRIQILPIWIVKQIFSYLDQKTLQKVKNVNNYWSYVVTDINKEKAARKYMDKTIKKMRATLETSEIDFSGQNKLQIKACRISQLDKRLEKLSCRAAVHPKLRKVNEIRTNQASLLQTATLQGRQKYLMPVDKLEIL